MENGIEWIAIPYMCLNEGNAIVKSIRNMKCLRSYQHDKHLKFNA